MEKRSVAAFFSGFCDTSERGFPRYQGNPALERCRLHLICICDLGSEQVWSHRPFRVASTYLGVALGGARGSCLHPTPWTSPDLSKSTLKRMQRTRCRPLVEVIVDVSQDRDNGSWPVYIHMGVRLLVRKIMARAHWTLADLNSSRPCSVTFLTPELWAVRTLRRIAIAIAGAKVWICTSECFPRIVALPMLMRKDEVCSSRTVSRP